MRAGDFIGFLRTDGLTLVEASPRFFRDFECTQADIADLELADLISPRDRPALVTIDRITSRDQRAELVATLSLSGVDRMARLIFEPCEGGWMIVVECIDQSESLIGKLYRQQRRWAQLLKGSLEGFAVLDMDGRVLDCDGRLLELMGLCSEHGVLLTEAAIIGRPLSELLDPQRHGELLRELDRSGEPREHQVELSLDDRRLELITRPMHARVRGVVGCGLTLRDVSDRYAAEQLEIQHHLEVIEAQRAAIRALSAPRIPITNALTVVPLVGALDRERMQEISEDLLAAVVRERTRTVVFDVTGVPALDAGAVAALLRTSRALGLVGVRTSLTGISPAIARVMVAEEFHIEELRVHANLKDAIIASLQA